MVHTWTLALEEQFYLVWPGLVLLIGPRALIPVAIGLVLLSPVLRALWLPYDVLLGHCDGLALGALLAILKRAGPGIICRHLNLVLLGVFLLPLALCLGMSMEGSLWALDAKTRLNVVVTTTAYTYFGLIGLVVFNAGHRWLGFLRNPTLAYLGKISYGLYLYHWIIYVNLDVFFKFGHGYQDPWWLDVLKPAVALFVAVLSWHLIEQPILSLKDRFSYSKSLARGPLAKAIPSQLQVDNVPIAGTALPVDTGP
jgi:peptidoglycan/LPS O-acetylase OafA/YrhL